VWHKALRLDRIFGTGKPLPYRLGPENVIVLTKIDEVISKYEEITAIRSENERFATSLVLALFQGDSATKNAKLRSLRYLFKSLTDGELTVSQFLGSVQTSDFFGNAKPNSALSQSRDAETSSDSTSALIALCCTMPEEYSVIRESLVALIGRRGQMQSKEISASAS
jgi:hypothetical protein